MEKDWPILEECPQYRHGLIDVNRYPWEEDGYVFDFDSYYPPIPDEPPWFRKLLDSTKNKIRPPFPEIPPEEDIDSCPICLPSRKRSRGPHVPRTCSNPELWNELMKKDEMEIRENPVWNMDPIPCPFHILDHYYHPLNDSAVVVSPPSFVTPEQLESTKQFLKEVRATRGYNVQSTMHPCLVSSYEFRQQDLDEIIYQKTRREFLIEHYLNPLIDHINFKTGKIYKLVNILRSVSAYPLVLLTFSAAASPAPEETFIATMFGRPLCPLDEIQPGSNPHILECLLRPDYDAPCKTRQCNEEDIRKESFAFIERRTAFYLGTAETTKTRKRELGEGSHTSAQKRGPCAVAEEKETDMTLPSKDKDTMVEQLKKRELELTAQLEEVRAKLVNLDSRFQSHERTETAQVHQPQTL